MALGPGSKLGPYEILAPLGAGGMGEVYRAHDPKLSREVAIKVLATDVTRDPERISRFRREATLLAALNHPHIAAIYGLEESDGSPFLVLELVEGEDLAERLKRGPIPIDEALDIARQIAEALEEAHGKGIVHRDLKPANVKLTPDGKVKVLDFGLAKAYAPDGDQASEESSRSPTLTVAGTQAGVILGTGAYMSPEQARGKPVDKRADIWAFGVVLFEMLTGRRLFSGETVSDVLAAVLSEEPPWNDLPQQLPAATARVLRRCLRKPSRERLHDIADVRIELNEAPEAETPRSGAPLATPRSRWLGSALPWAVALAAIAGAVWTGLRTTPGAPPQPVVAAILPPPGAEFLVDRGLALSPDGRQLVFAAREGEGPDELWLRPLGTGAVRRLAGTEEGRSPFWSPDGRHVAFFADGKLKRMDVETGLVESLAEYTTPRQSGAWSPRGEIVFTTGIYELDRVQARGGEPEVAVPGQVAADRLWPAFLPDGKRFPFLARVYGDDSPFRQLRVASLSGELDQAVMPLNSNAVYAPPGHLVWWQDGNLRAQRFDTERLAVEGEPRVLAAAVQFDPSRGLAAFSLAGTTLVYREGGLLLGNELVRLSRTGEDLGPVSPPGNYYYPRLSPDGSRVAVDRSDETNRGDIWIYEMDRATGGLRLTTAPEDESEPFWSPDGSQIAHFVALGNGGGIRLRAAGGGGGGYEELSVTGRRLVPSSWSSGGLLLVDRDDDIWVYALDDGSFAAYLETRFSERNPTWSPDRRLVAYDSDETGSREVYIQTFPDPARRRRVSTAGGHSPVWKRDGGEIYYITGDDELVAVTVQETPGTGNQDLRLSPAEVLFRVDLKISERRQYDTLDGETFILNRNRDAGSTTPLTLVLNVDLDEGIRRSEP